MKHEFTVIIEKDEYGYYIGTAAELEFIGVQKIAV
jgi:predicted RNase H-like HicB family nuclease